MIRSVLPLVLCVAGSAFGATQSWPSFRGPNASGVSDSAQPPVFFGPKSNVVWKAELTWSPSSPCLWGNRLFLTTFADGKLEVRGYDTENGHLLWRSVVPHERLEEFHLTEGSPAASTPATDGRRVVSYFGSFGLICHDFKGTELWRHPMPVAATSGGFGSGTSPLIVGDLVILNRDLNVNSTLFAVSLKTGKTVWEMPRPESPTSYGSPVIWEHDGQKELVVAGSLTMKGYEPRTGKELWTLTGLPSYTCTTPVMGDGMLFFAGWSPGKADAPWPSWESTVEKADKNGDGKIAPDEFAGGPAWFKAQDLDHDGFLTRKDWDTIGGLIKRGENVLLALKPGGRGVLPESQVAWKFGRGLPYVPSVLHYQSRVYLVKDGGMMSSFDARTGKSFYVQERLNAGGSYYASPVAAAGRIYLASLDGVLTVVKAGGDAPEILHQVKFGERIAGSPALAGDRLYLRTQTSLYAIGGTPSKH